MEGTDSKRLDPQLATRWAEVFRQHQKWLWTVTRSREPNHDEAADVLQEVACTLVQQTQPPESICRLEPWLYRVVVRHVQMHRRKLGRQRKHCEQWSQIQETAQADGLEWVLREESRQEVRHSLGCLRPVDRDIVMLKYVERWTYRDIAGHLGISRHAVEYRLQRARSQMRQQLSGHSTATAGVRLFSHESRK